MWEIVSNFVAFLENLNFMLGLMYVVPVDFDHSGSRQYLEPETQSVTLGVTFSLLSFRQQSPVPVAAPSRTGIQEHNGVKIILKSLFYTSQLYLCDTSVWIFEDKGQLEVDFASKSVFEGSFFFYLTFTDIQRNNGNNSENKGFRKIKSIKQWKTQKIVLPNEYF